MRIGYPCLNLSLPSRPSRTFRLASYSDARLEATVAANLDGLEEIVAWNRDRGLLFHRITSDLVPFASHPVCAFDWRGRFADRLGAIGKSMREAGMRVSMHPDPFTLLNSPRPGVVEASRRELSWHADLLDLMELGPDARIQIHVGGLYGERVSALARFEAGFRRLPENVRARLAVENDERLFPLADCLELHGRLGVPVILDTFHHALLNRGEPLPEAARLAAATWVAPAGPPMADYSSQAPGARRGAHAATLDPADFRAALPALAAVGADLMLEIKDKETSALAALGIVKKL